MKNESLLKGFYASVTKDLGLDLPEKLSQRRTAQSDGSLQDFLKAAPLTNKSGQDLLVRLVRKFFGDASDWTAQVVQPYASGKPGFANKPLTQPECYTPNETMATMAGQSVVAAVVNREQAGDENYIRRIMSQDVPRNVVASCEDLLINGQGSGITGLLHIGEEDCRKDSESQLDFFYRALKEYASRAVRMPTHIILPYTEILRLLASDQKMAFAARGFRHKDLEVFGVPVIESNAIPKNQGLILAADEIVLASSPGLEWKFGHSNSDLQSRDLSAIMLKYQMGLSIKRPETVRRIYLGEDMINLTD